MNIIYNQLLQSNQINQPNQDQIYKNILLIHSNMLLQIIIAVHLIMLGQFKHQYHLGYVLEQFSNPKFKL